MRPSDVFEVIDALAEAGVATWLGGGWGVDALVGRQTRSHVDVDVALRSDQLEAARNAIQRLGFAVTVDEFPGRVVLTDGSGREVDLHVVAMHADGSGTQRMPSGDSFFYPREAFEGRGRIDGRELQCLSPRTLMAFHVGYEPAEKDRHNVRLLHESLGAPLAAPYRRPTAVVTGASRRQGIAAAVARRLARDGWDVATTCWRRYDESMPWGGRRNEADDLIDELRRAGGRAVLCETDLSEPTSPARVFDTAQSELGDIDALVNAHAYSTRGGVSSTSVEDFDRHMDVNARGTLLMTAEYDRRWDGVFGTGRIVNLTSDAALGEIAYSASKGAVERITVASAMELGPRGITVNAVNPGPTDTGWMSDDVYEEVVTKTPLKRAGAPDDAARLVAFLCSHSGRWITGQILFSDGGSSLVSA